MKHINKPANYLPSTSILDDMINLVLSAKNIIVKVILLLIYSLFIFLL